MLELSQRLQQLVSRSESEFARLNDAETVHPAISGGWSKKQILGHLIDSASNNHQRFVRALLEDELRWPGYDQSGCVRVERFQEAAWKDLIALWAAYNRLLAHIVAGAPDAKRNTPCFIGQNPMMTLEQLVADYIVHTEHHLQQITPQPNSCS